MTPTEYYAARAAEEGVNHVAALLDDGTIHPNTPRDTAHANLLHNFHAHVRTRNTNCMEAEG